MTRIYDCGNKEIKIWINKYCPEVVEVEDNGKTYKRSVRSDANGNFITWDQNKIYLNQYKHISIADIKTKLNNDEFISYDELCQAILCEGIDKVRFEVPFPVVDCRFMGLVSINPNKRVNKICHIEESFQRMVEDGYKLALYPDEFDGETTSHEDYYVTDLVSSLKKGYIKLV